MVLIVPGLIVPGLIGLALGLAGVEPVPPAAPPPAPAPVAAPAVGPIVGGYTAINPRASELGPVVRAAVARITPQPRARGKVLAAERQVVAGTNYRLLLKLRDGTRWRVVVWQKLDGTRQVTEVARQDD